MTRIVDFDDRLRISSPDRAACASSTTQAVNAEEMLRAALAVGRPEPRRPPRVRMTSARDPVVNMRVFRGVLNLSITKNSCSGVWMNTIEYGLRADQGE